MSSNNDIAIKVTGISKTFKLPHEKNSSIKSIILNPFKKRTYEKQEVLKDINFEIKKGEFFGIVGRNGSGKSTLLKLLAGIYSPDKGHILVNGKLTPFIELGVGFNPELTGRENVFLNGSLLGIGRKEIKDMYEDIVEFAELEKFMDQKLKNYSSGMQVRLAFSIATRVDAPILLLDEVLAVGDVAFQRKCYNYFKDLKRKNKTVILVTHDMDVVREFCDKAVLISEGRLQFEGSAQETAREYAKLFDDSAKTEGPLERYSKEADALRWGDKKIRYTKVSLEKKGESFIVEAVAEANEDVTNPVFGFVVRSFDGGPILGTNSKIKQTKVEKMSKGKVIKITWEFPDVFANGMHLFDLAITQPDGATVHDWWESVYEFEIKNKDRTPYIISPSIKIKLK